MSDERSAESPTNPTEFPTVQSPNFRVIYANGFTYKPSLAEFGLTPLIALPITRNVDGNLVTSDVALQEVMIMLSLASAKALAKNMTLMIEVIEKEIGQIRLPRGSVIGQEQINGLTAGFKLRPLEES